MMNRSFIFSIRLLFTVILAVSGSRPAFSVTESGAALLASTFFGGSGKEGFNYADVNMVQAENGDIYFSSTSNSPDLPLVLGGFLSDCLGEGDVFIARMDCDLKTLKGTALMGGSNREEVRSIALGSDGSVYVSGITESSNFPVTSNAYDQTFHGIAPGPYGYGDAFICRFSADLSRLTASTFLGGESHESCNAMALDAQGNVFVAGASASGDFPVTASGFDQVKNSNGNFAVDGYISKLSGDLSSLLASTFIGGSGDDFPEALSVASGGAVYITGWTSSGNYPTTQGAFDTGFNLGVYDAFVSRLDGGLSHLEASTLYGGMDWEMGYCMALSPGGDVYISGHTATRHLPMPSDAWTSSLNSSLGRDVGDDVFIARFDSLLTTLKSATYLGGTRWENSYSLVLAGGSLFVSGNTNSANFPVTDEGFETVFQGGQKYMGDVFISRFDLDLTTQEASTFLGKSLNEKSGDLLIDSRGRVIISGCTASQDFPVSPGCFCEDYMGGGDCFMAQLSLDLGAVSSVERPSLPTDFRLYPASPNPFNPRTTIRYSLAQSSDVSMVVFDALGRRVRTLVSRQPASEGVYLQQWDGTDDFNTPVGSGVYFCVLSAGDETASRRMVLLK